ncbi:MAG: hypothetical protein WCN95_07750 [bacterium]
MSDDLDRIESHFRSQAYAVENPKKVLKMDPDQGSNRGFSGTLTGGGKHSTEQHHKDSQDEPEAARPAVQSVDTVIVSPAAQRLLEHADIEPPKPLKPPLPCPVPEQNSDHPHVDLTA